MRFAPIMASSSSDLRFRGPNQYAATRTGLDRRTHWDRKCDFAFLGRRYSAFGGLAPGVRKRGDVRISDAGVHWHSAGLQLRAHAARGLQQRALYCRRVDRGKHYPRIAPLGRQPDDHYCRAAYDPGVCVGRIQEAERDYLDGGLRAATAYAGFRAHRLSSAHGTTAPTGLPR